MILATGLCFIILASKVSISSNLIFVSLECAALEYTRKMKCGECVGKLVVLLTTNCALFLYSHPQLTSSIINIHILFPSLSP